MNFTFLSIIMVAVLPLQGQIIKQPLMVGYPGSGAYSQNFSDIFSATTNEASLAQLKTAGFGVYTERRFLLAELTSCTAVVAFPSSSGVFGFEGDYFGSAAFNESELGFIYARKITAKIDIGTKFNYYSIRIPGYGSPYSINFEAGALFHLTDKLHAGIHVYNPAGSELRKTSKEKLASVYISGVGYEVSEMVFIYGEIVKQQGEAVYVNAGFQYNLQKSLFIRTGISSLANNNYAAIGLQLNFARIDINVNYHPQLGFTPGLLLLFNLKKQSKD